MKKRSVYCWLLLFQVVCLSSVSAGKSLDRPGRAREFGLLVGVLPPGEKNAIVDVAGVLVGQESLVRGLDVRTGVTVILPHGGNLFQEKVPAAIYCGNGFGKLAGLSQVEELGNIETPIVLTNTLAVAAGLEALVEYTLLQPGNQQVRSVNGVVGETNDGLLNDIRGRHLGPAQVLRAIAAAGDGFPAEGNAGAGTGTVCFGFKGGIGTSSRRLPETLGGYTVGVLVQSNFGGVLSAAGLPLGRLLGCHAFSRALQENADGSCMIVVATDAPLLARNLKRLAKRAMLGLGRSGGIAAHGSGDYVIAFSTAPGLRIRPGRKMTSAAELDDSELNGLFLAVIEATEEAILNSLFMAESMTGFNGAQVVSLREAIASDPQAAALFAANAAD